MLANARRHYHTAGQQPVRTRSSTLAACHSASSTPETEPAGAGNAVAGWSPYPISEGSKLAKPLESASKVMHILLDEVNTACTATYGICEPISQMMTVHLTTCHLGLACLGPVYHTQSCCSAPACPARLPSWHVDCWAALLSWPELSAVPVPSDHNSQLPRTLPADKYVQHWC